MSSGRVLWWGACAFALWVPISIAFSQMALGVCILAWLTGVARGRIDPARDRVTLVLALLVGVCALSVWTGVDSWGAARNLRSLWVMSPLVVLPAALRTERDRRVLTSVLAIGFTASVVFGIAQRLVDVTNLFRIGRVTVARYLGDEVRITGFFDHPLTFAGQIVVLGAFFLVLVPEGAWPRRGRMRGWGWALPPLTAVALALSFTRSAWIAAVIALAAFGLSRRRLRTASVVGAVVLAVIAATLLWPSVGERATSLGHLASQQREMRRLDMWAAALEMAEDRPLFGVGWTRYEPLAGRYDPELADWASHAHSNLFQVIAELGWIGLTVYCALWIAIGRALWRRWLEGGRSASFALAAAVALVAFHVMGLFEFNFGDSEVVMATLLLTVLGITPVADPGSRAAGAPS